MSYCRFIEADAYLFPTDDGTAASVECCYCALKKSESQWFATLAEVQEHLAEHRAAGHSIPDYVDEEIAADFAANEYGLGL